MSKKTILVDPSRCIQCSNCWVACKDEHCDNDWSPYTGKQAPDHRWIDVRGEEAGGGSRIELQWTPVMCQHCAKPACAKAAPDAVEKREDGFVLFDMEKSKGRKELVEACPYGAVFWNDELDMPQKCTGCAHLLDAGRERPRCVAACPAGALQWVDVDELNEVDLYAPLERLNPEYGTEPMVAYVNTHKPFISGEITDFAERDCVEDALVVATHQVTGESYEAYSGTYGDFKVRVKKPGFYTVMVKADGYKRKTVSNIDVRKSSDLGLVKLHKLV